MRTAIYGRVSTKDGRQEVENQLAQLREFAAAQHWEICQEYVDHESGSIHDRQQFKRLFDDASRHKFDTVLFWSLDRLTREGTFETLQHLNRLSACGVGYRSYTEQYLDSTGIWKDAIIGILSTIAKQERIRISERTKAGLATARKNGKHLGRPKTIVNLSEVSALRASGLGWKRIARKLGMGVGTLLRAAA